MLSSSLTDAHGWSIVPSSAAAVGAGMWQSTPLPNGTGPGFTNRAFDTGYTSCSHRYYIKRGKGYINYPGGPHGPGITVDGCKGAFCCGMGGTLELPMDNLHLYRASSPRKCCSNGSGNSGPSGAGGDECDITQPATNPREIMQNDRWDMIEERYVVDSSCVGNPAATNCNGRYHLLVNDAPYLIRDNVNMGGFEFNGRLKSRRSQTYHHRGWMPWRPQFFFDNVKVVCNQTYTPIVIGRAPSENARGPGDATSPYFGQFYGAEFKGGLLNNDCSGAGRMSLSNSSWYRPNFGGSQTQSNAPGYAYPETSRTTDGFGKNELDGPCQSPALNGSMRVQLTTAGTGDGGGIVYYGFTDNSTHNTKYSEGWVNFPSGQDYSNNASFSGFINYGCFSGSYSRCGQTFSGCDQAEFGNFIAPAVISSSGFKWGVMERRSSGSANASPSISFVSTKTVDFDTWNLVSFEIKTGNLYSLTVNGEVLVRDRPFQLPTTAGTTGGNYGYPSLSGSVTGVIDWCGTLPFAAYFDGSSQSTASTRSCDGWGSGGCPFTSVVPSAPAFENLLARRVNRFSFARN